MLAHTVEAGRARGPAVHGQRMEQKDGRARGSRRQGPGRPTDTGAARPTRSRGAASATNCYSLRSELLVAEMDVSRRILVLDTSIFKTSNSERRE